jgi:hypothetical protein
MDDYMQDMKNISGRLWKWYKEHADCENKDEEWWNNLLSSGEAIINEYKDSKAYFYASKYLIILLHEIGEMSRGHRG